MQFFARKKTASGQKETVVQASQRFSFVLRQAVLHSWRSQSSTHPHKLQGHPMSGEQEYGVFPMLLRLQCLWVLTYETGFVLWKSWHFFGLQFLNYKILAICHPWENNLLDRGLCLVQCVYPKVTYKLTVYRIKWHHCSKCYLMCTIIVDNCICEHGPPRYLFTHDIYFLEKSLS